MFIVKLMVTGFVFGLEADLSETKTISLELVNHFDVFCI